MKLTKWIAALFPCLLILPTASLCAPAPGSILPDYSSERSARAAELTQPYGWLSLIALEWLKPGATTVGSSPDNTLVLPGAPAHLVTFEQRDGRVTVAASSPLLTFHGRSFQPGQHPVIGSGEDDNSALASGRLRMWVIDRSGRRYLRVKDPQAPSLKQFHGLRWYPPDPRLRIQARWIPDSPQHVMHVTNQIGQTTPVSVPGHVEFELDGAKQTLWPLEAEKDGLWFVFRDQSYLQTTYGGGRFLTTDVPSKGLDQPGTVILDFNQAVNPPCAYSPFATCPLASPENRLRVAVPAGEKRYVQ
jgi:uncharacterized protein (DUF1684 family)